MQGADSRIVKIVLRETEKLLDTWKHPDPYIPPTAPGGTFQNLSIEFGALADDTCKALNMKGISLVQSYLGRTNDMIPDLPACLFCWILIPNSCSLNRAIPAVECKRR